MRRDMLSVDEAAERLGVSPYWLRKLLRAGEVRGWKVSGREKAHWRVPLAEVERRVGGVGGRGGDGEPDKPIGKSAA